MKIILTMLTVLYFFTGSAFAEEKKQLNEVEISKIKKELKKDYSKIIDRLNKALSGKTVHYAEFAALRNYFKSFAKNRYIESATAIEHVWFERMSKGLEILYLYKDELSDYSDFSPSEMIEVQKSEEYKLLARKAKSTRKKLAEVMALRNTKYAIEK